jgi:hypothetical protein
MEKKGERRMAKLKRKSLIIGFLCFVVVALVAAFAIPVLAAGSPPFGPRGGVNKNITVVQGTVANGGLTAKAITINKSGTPSTQVTLTLNDKTNFNIHGIDWINNPAGFNGKPVTASYTGNQTSPPLIAIQVTINLPVPTPPTPGAVVPKVVPPGSGKPLAPSTMGRVQGKLVKEGPDTINVTFTEPSGILSLSGNNTVTILYSSGNYTIQGLMTFWPGATPAITPPLPKNMAMVLGTITKVTPGEVVISFTEPSSSKPLTVGPNNEVTILYNNRAPYAIQSLMSGGPRAGFGGGPGFMPFNVPGGNHAAPRFGRPGTT